MMNFFAKIHNQKSNKNKCVVSIDVSDKAEYARNMLLSNPDRYFNYPEIMSFPEEQRCEIIKFALSNWCTLKPHISYAKIHYGEQWYKNSEANKIIDKLEYIFLSESRRLTTLIKILNSKKHGFIKGTWEYRIVSPKYQCKYEEHKQKNGKQFYYPENIQDCENLPGCMPGCSCDYLDVLDFKF